MAYPMAYTNDVSDVSSTHSKCHSFSKYHSPCPTLCLSTHLWKHWYTVPYKVKITCGCMTFAIGRGFQIVFPKLHVLPEAWKHFRVTWGKVQTARWVG